MSLGPIGELPRDSLSSFAKWIVLGLIVKYKHKAKSYAV